MDELRKLQQVSNSTLTVSIPSEYVKHLGLKKGGNIVVKEEVDGTLRLIPTARKPKTAKASIRVDVVGMAELLSRLVVELLHVGVRCD